MAQRFDSPAPAPVTAIPVGVTFPLPAGSSLIPAGASVAAGSISLPLPAGESLTVPAGTNFNPGGVPVLAAGVSPVIAPGSTVALPPGATLIPAGASASGTDLLVVIPTGYTLSVLSATAPVPTAGNPGAPVTAGQAYPIPYGSSLQPAGAALGAGQSSVVIPSGYTLSVPSVPIAVPPVGNPPGAPGFPVPTPIVPIVPTAPIVPIPGAPGHYFQGHYPPGYILILIPQAAAAALPAPVYPAPTA